MASANNDQPKRDRFKPGSRVQKVWEKFLDEGSQAAFDYGLTLDLKPNTLRSWMKGIFNGKDPLRAEARPVNTEGNTLGKRRCHASYWPERLGVLLEQGPQSSVVRWDNGMTSDANIPNRLCIMEDTGEPLPVERRERTDVARNGNTDDDLQRKGAKKDRPLNDAKQHPQDDLAPSTTNEDEEDTDMAKKAKAAKKAKKAATGNARGPRVKYEDGHKIKVVGENGRREGSRYHTGYENLKKAGTVGAFRKKHPDDATELLGAAVKDGYIKISA